MAPTGRRGSLVDERFRAMYVHDGLGRITTSNEFEGGPAPRMHLMRTRDEVVVRFSDQVGDELAAQLSELVAAELPWNEPHEPPRHRDDYRRLLGQVSPVDAVWVGPAFVCPHDAAADDETVVSIDHRNSYLLSPDLVVWRRDVGRRSPFMASVVDGQAASVCASSRMSDAVHEAGIETAPRHRRHGHAVRVARAWASAVGDLGATPIYSTSWNNAASVATAASLGAELWATDFHLR
jgi:hypothetical protein